MAALTGTHAQAAPPHAWPEARSAPHHELDRHIVTELRRALDEGELRLHYQPLVDPRTGEIIAAEALLRWQHPEKGLLAPGAFLEAAVASPLSLELAEWVAGEAVAECARWPVGWHVSINLSPRQILLGGSRGLRETLAWLCRVHDVSPRRLCIELTEQESLDSTTLVALLDGLSALGIRVAVDDFGNGSASLGRLRQLPFDVAKVDRSLLDDFDDPTTRMTLRLAIELARASTSTVVVEGVETAAQLELLRRLDCDLVQGYHLARPMSADELRELAGSLLRPPAVGDHTVALYEEEGELARLVTDFLVPGLRRGASAVVIARPDRVEAIAAGLTLAGFDPDRLRDDRRLVELDAATKLDETLVDGDPDVAAYSRAVNELGQLVAPGTGPVRIFGQLSPILLDEGRLDTAVRLESLWNDLEPQFPFTLLCAYPTSSFRRPGGTEAFARLLRACHHRCDASAAARATAAHDLADPAFLHQELEIVRAERDLLSERVLD